jgi:hypothetical protein
VLQKYLVDRNFDTILVKSVVAELEPEEELGENFLQMALNTDKMDMDDLCLQPSGLVVSLLNFND